jgi:hypothetical protein
LEEREVSAILEISIKQLMNPEIVKSKEITLGNKLKLETPYFDLKDEVVWGATAAILSELKLILSS